MNQTITMKNNSYPNCMPKTQCYRKIQLSNIWFDFQAKKYRGFVLVETFP